MLSSETLAFTTIHSVTTGLWLWKDFISTINKFHTNSEQVHKFRVHLNHIKERKKELCLFLFFYFFIFLFFYFLKKCVCLSFCCLSFHQWKASIWRWARRLFSRCTVSSRPEIHRRKCWWSIELKNSPNITHSKCSMFNVQCLNDLCCVVAENPFLLLLSYPGPHKPSQYLVHHDEAFKDWISPRTPNYNYVPEGPRYETVRDQVNLYFFSVFTVFCFHVVMFLCTGAYSLWYSFGFLWSQSWPLKILHLLTDHIAIASALYWQLMII